MRVMVNMLRDILKSISGLNWADVFCKMQVETLRGLLNFVEIIRKKKIIFTL